CSTDTAFGDTSSTGMVWRLNLDSLNLFTSTITHAVVVGTGNQRSVTFQPRPDGNAIADTVRFALRYDPSLLLDSISFPFGWNFLDSSSNENSLVVTIFDTSETVDTPAVTLYLQQFLTSTPTPGMVWLDSANLFGKWMNCDIYATSATASDSVQLDFTGCGDSILLETLRGEPFTFSIVPNPAENEIRVEGAAVSALTISDPLGRVYPAPLRTTGGEVAFDISSLPPGVYFVSNGRSRAKFVKE
ncbi:MAG TPA: T9SS type A sorting domain-containing protein, partial [Candidatus Kapabacteria bacterium]